MLLLNLAAIFILAIPSASWFSNNWWSHWFPAYVVWPAFLVLARVYRGKSVAGDDLDSSQD